MYLNYRPQMRVMRFLFTIPHVRGAHLRSVLSNETRPPNCAQVLVMAMSGN